MKITEEALNQFLQDINEDLPSDIMQQLPPDERQEAFRAAVAASNLYRSAESTEDPQDKATQEGAAGRALELAVGNALHPTSVFGKGKSKLARLNLLSQVVKELK